MNAAMDLYAYLGCDLGGPGISKFLKTPKLRRPKNNPAGSKFLRCLRRHGACQFQWKTAVARKA